MNAPTTSEPDPTVSQRLHDWQRLNEEFPTSDQRGDELTDQMGAIERQMVDTPARTIPDLLVKLCFTGAVIKALKAEIAEGKLIEERLLMSALGDLEEMDRLAEQRATTVREGVS